MSASVVELENFPWFLTMLAEKFVPSYGSCTGVLSGKILVIAFRSGAFLREES